MANALLPIRPTDEDLSILAAGLEACPVGMAVVEADFVVYSNAAFSQLLGYPGTLRGIPLRQLFVTELAGSEGASDRSGLKAESFSELRALRQDGSVVKMEFACSRFEVGRRKLLMIAAGERAAPLVAGGMGKASQRLESLGRMAGAVAHDFNNLLTGILLYCDLLKAGLEESHPLRAYVAEIHHAGSHSAELVQQLMAVARPGEEGPATHSWGEVITGVRNLLLRLLGENIDLQTNMGSPATRVRMEPGQMRQIVINLLLNARDAMPGGGRILLACAECHECEERNCVLLTVEDNGCGMDADTRAHLFETFFTTKQPGQGTGLGLSTIRRTVEEHGGEIRVESEPGRGTRMSVHLPRVRPTGQVTLITQEKKDR